MSLISEPKKGISVQLSLKRENEVVIANFSIDDTGQCYTTISGQTYPIEMNWINEIVQAATKFARERGIVSSTKQI